MAGTTSIYHPESLEDALAALDTAGARPIGGGVAVLLRARLGERRPGQYVALGRLPELRRIELDPGSGELIVGGSVTLAELATADAARAGAPLLAAAARGAASPGIRSIATVAGNVVDAPAASDLVAAAMALGATLEIRSPADVRRLPVISLAASTESPILPGEAVVALRLPPPPAASGWNLQRLRTQGEGDRPAVTVALTLRSKEGAVDDVGAAATFLADRPLDLAEIGVALAGAPLADVASGALGAAIRRAAAESVTRAVDAGAAVVDDARGSAGYRRDVLAVLAGRAAIHAAGVARR